MAERMVQTETEGVHRSRVGVTGYELCQAVSKIRPVRDRKNGQQVFASNSILINEYIQPGNLLVPVGLSIPAQQLQAGDYRFEIKGRDSAGNVSAARTADFSIQ